MKKIIALSLLIAQFQALCAQNIPDSFVQAQIPLYRHWLESYRLSRFISLDTIQAESGSAILFLKTLDAKNWERLSHYLDSAYHADLFELLFDRFVFQLDLDRKYAQVNIAGIDHSYILTSEAGRLRITAIINQGENGSGIDLPLAGILDPENRRTIPGGRSISSSQPKLVQGLKAYFSNYSTTMTHFTFEDLSDNDSTLLYEISNITKAVLDESYFEKLTLSFNFVSIGKNLLLSYKIEGKYAGGLLWTPHESRYRPMTPEFQQQLDKFTRKLGNQIRAILQ